MIRRGGRLCYTCIHMSHSCIHMCDTTRTYECICVTWWCDVTGTCPVFSFICVTWLICMCAVTHLDVWHDSFIRVTWLLHMCDMTHSYVWHDSFIYVTWLIYLSQFETSVHVLSVCVCVCVCVCVRHASSRASSVSIRAWHDSFVHVTWFILTRHVTHLYMGHESFIRATLR